MGVVDFLGVVISGSLSLSDKVAGLGLVSIAVMYAGTGFISPIRALIRGDTSGDDFAVLEVTVVGRVFLRWQGP